MRRLLLASGSPRRRELIHHVSEDVDVVATDVDESVPDGTPPDVMVRDVALRKAHAAVMVDSSAVIVAADTTVALDGRWLGKPADATEAAEMLTHLQGREHQVFTGLAVVADGRVRTDVVLTTVTMAPMSADAVAVYVATGRGLDKAGAYGIQGTAGTVVAAIEGCYTNVVGLSLCALAVLLARSGVPVDAPAPACGFGSARRCPHPAWTPSPAGAAGVDRAPESGDRMRVSGDDALGQPAPMVAPRLVAPRTGAVEQGVGETC